MSIHELCTYRTAGETVLIPRNFKGRSLGTVVRLRECRHCGDTEVLMMP